MHIILGIMAGAQVVVFKKLAREAITNILRRAITNDHRLKAANIKVADDAFEALAIIADGDARVALNGMFGFFCLGFGNCGRCSLKNKTP